MKSNFLYMISKPGLGGAYPHEGPFLRRQGASDDAYAAGALGGAKRRRRPRPDMFDERATEIVYWGRYSITGVQGVARLGFRASPGDRSASPEEGSI
jgi:hypothetical protein